MAVHRQFKHVVVIAFVAWILSLAGATACQAGERPEGTEGADRLNSVLQERRAVLEELVKVQFEAYQTNLGGIERVIRARRQLLSVELDLESRPEERIRLITDFVETMSDCEKLAKQMYKANKTTVADVLEATAARLAGQAELLREQRE